MMQKKYQWQYSDLKKAGINPILGSMQASVGSAPQTAPAQPMDLGASISKTKLSQEKRMNESAILRNAAEAERAKEAGVHSAASAKEANLRTDLLRLDINRATNASEIEADYPDAQKVERLIRVIGPVLGAGAGALIGGKAIKQLFRRHSKELKTMRRKRARSGSWSGRDPRMGSSTIPTNRHGYPIIAKPSSQHRNRTFEDF